MEKHRMFPTSICDIAWKAQRRLTSRCRRLVGRGKAKNDKIYSRKIAVLLRGGMLPQAYVYPAAMRSTRDLIRRRLPLVRKRGQLLAHIQNTRAQYNLPAFGRTLAYKANREGVSQLASVVIPW